MNHWLLKLTFLWGLLILFEYNTWCFACLEEERDGLLKLKPRLPEWKNEYHWEPDPLLTWVDNENSDCCGWKSVKCDNSTGRVIQLDFHGRYADDNFVLDASLFLPFQQLQHLDLSDNWSFGMQNLQDLGRLKKLEVLILGSNSFNNSILLSLSALTSLIVLDLSHNNINGSLSDYDEGLCELKNLQELDLSMNILSGPIPACFSQLTFLKVLDLSHNRLSGNLDPSLLSSLPLLQYFSLENNLHFDGNLMFTSLEGCEFQFKFVSLSNCNLNISTTQLVKLFSNQSNLIELDLSNNNLYGEVPHSLLETNSKLKLLNLKNNSLTGHIHFPVGHVVNLEWFDVSNNNIQGELQPNFGQVLSKLTYLNISNNDLGGKIPTSLRNMKNLETLDLSNNKLSGKLPERLDLSCIILGSIMLSNNRLEGQICDTLFNLTRLTVLDLSNNQFIGHIPSNNFKSFYLRTFDISRNHISGVIPGWLSNLTDTLNTLAMRDNSMKGYIPPELCNASSLLYLDLSQNQLSGPVPSCLITMPFLRSLHLQHNKLTGPLQKALLKSSSLLTLDLMYNNLSGKIPSWFGLLLNLRVLLLKGNEFGGSIPHELCRLQMIGIMDLSYNNLYGSIPPCFINITFGRIGVAELVEFRYPNHRDLMTTTNEYSFPDLITQLSGFEVTDLEQMGSEEVEFMMKSRNNSYKGEIINFMSGMDLSNNHLIGNIPYDIGVLTEIRALNLSHNHLIGSIPQSMATMKLIESIDLSHNKLSGEIPADLTRLTTLAFFTVAYNNLSGRVPDMVAQFSTFGETSYEGNPFLCGPPLLGSKCNVNVDLETDTLVGRNDMFGIDPICFLASFAATYAMCLLGFVIVLYINSYWRRRWFHLIDACLSFIFPFCSEAIYRREI